MTLITTLAVIIVSILLPDKDNTVLITTIIGISAPTTFSMLAFIKAQETHVLVNSRMTTFIEALEKSAKDQSIIAKAEGVQEGREEAHKRTDELKNKDTKS